MIEIDGAYGEGGGQIIRSSLTLSMCTGLPFRITNIRKGREKGGLRPQHLQAVKSSAEISGAAVKGDELGSDQLEFVPKSIKHGEYRWDIGTAGSTSLVLQTLLYPLHLAGVTSRIDITGGTHVRWSPPYHYLQWIWLPLIRELGYQASIKMLKAGYYPQGGGRVQLTVEPSRTSLQPMDLTERGVLESVKGVSVVSNLPSHIAERQRDQAISELEDLPCPVEVGIQRPDSPGKGTAVILQAIFASSVGCYFSLGALGKPAERVAEEAARGLRGFIQGKGALDKYMADQILLPLGLIHGESRYTTEEITNHLLTNRYIIQQFVEVSIEIEGKEGEPGMVRVQGRAAEKWWQ